MHKDSHKKEKDFQIDLMVPNDQVDLTAYEELLDIAFETPDAQNIAVTGIFGAGKSSIIRSYQKKHPEKKILIISLANLKNGKSIEKNTAGQNRSESSEEDQENREMDHGLKGLENRIYQQLRHYVELEKRSGFRLPDVGKSLFWKTILGAFLGIELLMLGFCWKFNEWQEFYPTLQKKPALLSVTLESDFFFMIAACAVVIFIFLLMMLFPKIKNISLEIKGGTVNLESDDTMPGLRERMDEIVQMIQKLKADAIVFEDLDRYPDIMAPVIENLIDINFMINMDTLPAWERWTKYWKCKFEGWLKKRNLDIGEVRWIMATIFVVIFFIICHQFSIYASIGYIAVLGLVVIFLIGKCRKWDRHVLFIYACNTSIFQNEENTKYFNLQIPVIPVLNRKNAENILKKRLEGHVPMDASDSWLPTISGYIDNYNQMKDILMNFYIYNKRIAEVGTEDVWLDKKKVFVFAAYKSFFPDDFCRLQQGEGYLDYVFKTIVPKERGTSGTGFQGNLPFAWQLRQKNQKEIWNLLTKNVPKRFRKLVSDKRFSIIVNLLCDGYLDEAYEDYVEYFYGNDSEIRERRFIESVHNGYGKPYEYELMSPEKICDAVEERFFESRAILNYSLIEYLLENAFDTQTASNRTKTERYQRQLKKILDVIVQQNRIDFVLGYMMTSQESELLNRFLYMLERIRDGFIVGIPDAIAVCDSVQTELLLQAVECAETIDEVFESEGIYKDYAGRLCRYIESDRYEEYFIELAEQGNEDRLMAFRTLGIKFRTLMYKGSFCRNIYNYKLFIISGRTLEEIYRWKCPGLEFPWTCPTDWIIQDKSSSGVVLKRYIADFPLEYLGTVVEYAVNQKMVIRDSKKSYDWLTEIIQNLPEYPEDDHIKIKSEKLLKVYSKMRIEDNEILGSREI